MRIRRGIRRDWPEIARVRMSVRENRIPALGALDLADVDRIFDGDGACWVCEVQGRIVGFAMADLSNANVYALFVEPEHESRGVGRLLHDAMMDWFFCAGVTRVWLSTDGGTRAERFYLRAGWEATGTESNGELRLEMSGERWLTRL